jgi:predicted Zn-dependent protease
MEATRARLDAFAAESEDEYAWWLTRLLDCELPDVEAIALALERALSVYPDSGPLRFSQARLLVLTGDEAAACEALYDVVVHQPEADAAWLKDEVEETHGLSAFAESDRFAGLLDRVNAERGASS